LLFLDVDVCMLTNMPFSVDYEKNYKISFHNELKGRIKEHVVESDNFPEDKLAKIFATHLRGSMSHWQAFDQQKLTLV
jgi:hypothetical protein